MEQFLFSCTCYFSFELHYCCYMFLQPINSITVILSQWKNGNDDAHEIGRHENKSDTYLANVIQTHNLPIYWWHVT